MTKKSKRKMIRRMLWKNPFITGKYKIKLVEILKGME